MGYDEWKSREPDLSQGYVQNVYQRRNDAIRACDECLEVDPKGTYTIQKSKDGWRVIRWEY